MKPFSLVTSRRALLVMGALVSDLWAARAEAHLVTTGLGPIYDGISHVLVSPDDLVPIVAMGVLSGMNGPAAGRRALFGLAAAWLAGGAAGLVASQIPVPAFATALSFMVLGALAALDRRLAPAVVTGLACAVGLLHGWLNGVGMVEAQRDASSLVGIVAATFTLVALVAAFALRVRAPWARVTLRVAGSWVAAIGLLMLGWSLRAVS